MSRTYILYPAIHNCRRDLRRHTQADTSDSAALRRTCDLLGHILLRHERVKSRLFADTFVALRLRRLVGLGSRLHPPQDYRGGVAARRGHSAVAARGARRVPHELRARRLRRRRLGTCSVCSAAARTDRNQQEHDRYTRAVDPAVKNRKLRLFDGIGSEPRHIEPDILGSRVD